MYKLYLMQEDILNKYVEFQNDLEQVRLSMDKKEISEIKAFFDEEIETQDSLYYVDDSGNAHIPIIGSLVEKPNICAFLFGMEQTTYEGIRLSIEQAEKDPNVKKIIFDMDTPGGEASGVDLTGVAIKETKKITEVRIFGMAASAGYWLASQANNIIAMTPTAEIGSIGVAVELIDKTENEKMQGFKRITLVSNGAEDKRPDITTKKGQEKIIARLNELHNIFISRVAEGRNITKEFVSENFGKGGVLIAEKSMFIGMIDNVQNKIGNPKKDYEENKGNNVSLNNDTQNKLEDSMNLKEFLESNPEALAEHENLIAEAKKEGIAKANDTNVKQQLEKERNNTIEVLEIAGYDLTENVRSCIMSGGDVKDFAYQEMTANKSKSKQIKQNLGTFNNDKQLPSDNKITKVREDGATEAQAREIAAWDEAFDKRKKGDK